MYDVITMGSATVDIFARTDSEMIKIIDAQNETNHVAFTTGTKHLIHDLIYSVGGGGTNTAAVFSKLGLKCAFLGKVGDDINGKLIMDRLKMRKIDTSLVAKGKGLSGFSIVLDNMEKDRVILSHKGINDSLTPKDIKPFKAKWLFSTSLMGTSYETLLSLTRKLKKQGVKIAVNPSLYMTKLGIAHLRPLLERTDLLIFNRKEAETLTGLKEIDSIFAILHQHGPSTILITQGKQGVYASDGKNCLHMSSRKVEAVDTTGAGDTFAATYLGAFIKGKDMETALRLGLENSCALIQEIGAKNGLQSWPTLLKRIKFKPVPTKNC
ncbi:carbohydrate kinase family protein [Candidatus Woesearchaeota archaeon]|nr:carbohydrate kinase family protein [Candidatus Woesearchaeota archaeon]